MDFGPDALGARLRSHYFPWSFNNVDSFVLSVLFWRWIIMENVFLSHHHDDNAMQGLHLYSVFFILYSSFLCFKLLYCSYWDSTVSVQPVEVPTRLALWFIHKELELDCYNQTWGTRKSPILFHYGYNKKSVASLTVWLDIMISLCMIDDLYVQSTCVHLLIVNMLIFQTS